MALYIGPVTREADRNRTPRRPGCDLVHVGRGASVADPAESHVEVVLRGRQRGMDSPRPRPAPHEERKGTA